MKGGRGQDGSLILSEKCRLIIAVGSICLGFYSSADPFRRGATISAPHPLKCEIRRAPPLPPAAFVCVVCVLGSRYVRVRKRSRQLAGTTDVRMPLR